MMADIGEEEDLDVSGIKTRKVNGLDGAFFTLKGESSDFEGVIDGVVIIWEVDEKLFWAGNCFNQ